MLCCGAEYGKVGEGGKKKVRKAVWGVGGNKSGMSLIETQIMV